jgi:hypothetical protein
MVTTQVVQGTVQKDGTLMLVEQLRLPPGPVRVTVEAAGSEGARESTWDVLERIWARNKALGLKPRTKEEIDAELQAMREEWEEHQQGLERIHDEARRAREQPPC